MLEQVSWATKLCNKDKKNECYDYMRFVCKNSVKEFGNTVKPFSTDLINVLVMNLCCQKKEI